ncbi:hypothetical protein [Rubritalea tangerina]|uniref:hypothetical protein n=1 Tax=Rubritalea tangerina TaxID=430798 RepID=UPI003611161E
MPFSRHERFNAFVCGGSCRVVCTGFDSSPDAVGWAALLVGSLLPDIDHKRSFIGSMCRGFQRLWRGSLGIGH